MILEPFALMCVASSHFIHTRVIAKLFIYESTTHTHTYRRPNTHGDRKFRAHQCAAPPPKRYDSCRMRSMMIPSISVRKCFHLMRIIHIINIYVVVPQIYLNPLSTKKIVKIYIAIRRRASFVHFSRISRALLLTSITHNKHIKYMHGKMRQPPNARRMHNVCVCVEYFLIFICVCE